VGRAYLAVLAQERIVDVSERARDVAQAHVDFARKRLTGGVGTQLDDVRAQEELATEETSVAAAHAGVARAQEALGVLVAGEGPIDAAGDPVLAEPPDAASGIAEAEAHRADVAAARRKLSAADVARDDDWKDYAPVLAIIGQGFYGTPQVDPIPRFGYQV